MRERASISSSGMSGWRALLVPGPLDELVYLVLRFFLQFICTLNINCTLSNLITLDVVRIRGESITKFLKISFTHENFFNIQKDLLLRKEVKVRGREGSKY